MVCVHHDYSAHNPSCKTLKQPEKLVRIEPVFYCEKCRKEIPEKFWKQHKENHKKIDRMSGGVKKYARKYF